MLCVWPSGWTIGALTLILLVTTVSVLVCIKLYMYLQRGKKITSKFMYSSYALCISELDFHYRRLSLTTWKFLGIELSYFSITSMFFFSLIPSLFPKRDGHGLGVKLILLYNLHGNSKTNETVFKASLLHATYMPLRIGQFVPTFKKWCHTTSNVV